MRQLELRGDVGQHILVDEFHGHNCGRGDVHIGGRIAAGCDDDGRDDGRPAKKALQPRPTMIARAGRRAVGAGYDDGSAGIVRAAAQEIEDRAKFGLERVDPVRIEIELVPPRVHELIGRIGNEDEILIGMQALPGTQLDPIGIELEADAADGAVGRGDALDLAQHAFGAACECTREQLPFGIDGDFIGAVGRAEHRDHDADDRDRHDDADRNRHAQARAIPTSGIAPNLTSPIRAVF